MVFWRVKTFPEEDEAVDALEGCNLTDIFQLCRAQLSLLRTGSQALQSLNSGVPRCQNPENPLLFPLAVRVAVVGRGYQLLLARQVVGPLRCANKIEIQEIERDKTVAMRRARSAC
jgi:hypothetical protein